MKTFMANGMKRARVLVLTVLLAVIACHSWSRAPTEEDRKTLIREVTEHRRGQVESARVKLQANLKRVRTETDDQKVKAIIDELGDAVDDQAIQPLADLVASASKSCDVRIRAAEAIFKIAVAPERGGNRPPSRVLNRALPALESGMASSDVRVRRSATTILYRMGEKSRALPALKKLLRDGDVGTLNTFYFDRKEGEFLVVGIMPGEKFERHVDSQAEPLLEEAGKPEFSDDIRLHVARMLWEMGKSEKSATIIRDLISGAGKYEFRSRAVQLAADINSEETQKIVDDAVQIPELKRLALRLQKRRH